VESRNSLARNSPLKTHHSKLKTEASAAQSLRTVGELVREGTHRFRRARLAFGHGSVSAAAEAAWLALHTLRLPPDATPGVMSRAVAPGTAERILQLFERRIRERKPAAYLMHEAWLGDLRFYVDERVIVPRSHIAGLLKTGLAPWIRKPGRVRSVLDLCTGSGCLAILSAHAFPNAQIDAADISPPALAVARHNVRDYRLGRRIRLVKSDLFSKLRGKHYDLIVCNPPYVTIASMRCLPPEYRHEPGFALAGGADGLDVVRRIVAESSEHLNPRGLLVVEVGRGRRRVERTFSTMPFIWPDTDAGNAVFVIAREGLQRQGT
jgi:ribosomal protein L3 glutamine methyltransferase